MQKRAVGFILAVLGFSGMALAGYIFVRGTGGRGHLVEVTSYMIVGAVCFFAGISYVYDSYTSFTEHKFHNVPELEEVSELQQQWRTIQIAKPTAQPVNQLVSEV
ncbi:MAG: hypothetical protein H0X41_03080 [Chitinophagaceae bacterium]|nr:hypothetical protein [Chitinophagaceae bacterium]